jgi:hypothetical protein
MTRLQAEYRRLYAPDPSALRTGDTEATALISPKERVRALVLSLARPADWDLLGELWRGVQSDLGWPAPAIAVSGVDAFQLWFSLAESLAVDHAHALLQDLCARYLPGVPAQRLKLLPTPKESQVPGQLRHAAPVPTEWADTGNWSAFVTPDLVAVFADTPWLDIPPGEDGQVTLLRGLQSISPAALAAATAELRAPPAPAPAFAGVTPPLARASAPCTDARQFLLAVMNDSSVPLALRIDAAKALLPPAGTPGTHGQTA